MGHIVLNEIKLPDNIKIFVLEDMESVQAKIVSDLRSMGFKGEFQLNSTLNEAIDNLDDSKAELILSDWNLPDGKGISFLEVVRSNSKLDNVPFLMLTTVEDVDKILHAVERGADGYIVKPWSITDLEENISFAYKKRNQ